MGKMKDFFKRKSIKTAFTISMLACIFSALLLSLALSNFCQWGQSRYYKKYQIQFGVSNPEMVIGFDKTEGNISYQTPLNLKDHFTPTDRTVYNILGFLSVGVYQFVLFSVLQSPVFCFINDNYRSLLLYWIMPLVRLPKIIWTSKSSMIKRTSWESCVFLSRKCVRRCRKAMKKCGGRLRNVNG